MINKSLVAKKIYLIIILFLIFILTIGITYSRYKSTRIGNLNGKVLKWHFELIDGIQETEEIDFPLTRTDENDEVPEEKMAPGTYGEIPIVIDTTGCEVDTKCEVKLEITNCPTNIIFYRDDEFENLGLDIVQSGTGNENDPKVTKVNSTFYINSQDQGIIEYTIFWKWNYETEGHAEGLSWIDDDVTQMDKLDSDDGNIDEIFFNIKVTGSQEEFDVDGIPFHAYVMLEENTLRFRNYDYTEEEKEGNIYYGDAYDVPISIEYDKPWTNDRDSIYTVRFDNIIKPRRTDGWFAGLANLTTFENMEYLNTSNVTDMTGMFIECTGIEYIDLSHFDTSKVKHMYGMFAYCTKLPTLDVSSFNTSSVIEMKGMFNYCEKLKTLDLSNFNTSNVQSMRFMFARDINLESIDMSNFNTTNVTDLGYMFAGCSKLDSLDLSSFNTENAQDLGYMFGGCSKLKSLDITNFVTLNVTNTSYMFYYCYNLESLDLSNMEVSNVTNMRYMFWYCSKLKTIYVNNFDISNVIDSVSMFASCSSLVGGSGTTYNSSYKDKTYARVDNPPDEPGYFTLKESE